MILLNKIINLSEKLNCRIDVYAKQEIKNLLGETDYTYCRIKSIWANIKPQGGRELDGQGNTIYAEISHKFIVRAKSISGLTNDMFFLFQGQKYEIKYFYPNYLLKNQVEIYCRLVVE